jgi:hypothetical protein
MGIRRVENPISKALFRVTARLTERAIFSESIGPFGRFGKLIVLACKVVISFRQRGLTAFGAGGAGHIFEYGGNKYQSTLRETE